MPQEYFGAIIHVMWPKGKKLGIYQVLACDADRTLHQLQVTGVDAYGLEMSSPHKPVSKTAKRKRRRP